MIVAESLPKIKQFLRPLGWSEARLTMLIRLVTAFVEHRGKMSASEAGEAIRTQGRHRASVGRFLGARRTIGACALGRLQRRVLKSELAQRGEWFFQIDQTFVGHQGQRQENTFRRGNYRSRKKHSGRHQKKTSRHACHCFVAGQLITPSGCRIPFFKSYLTRTYCEARGLAYRTQTKLAAELIDELPLPPEIRVTVLGDTAFEAKTIRAACRARNYDWIMPLNPERVLAGPRGRRPKVRSLIHQLKASDLTAVRLVPSHGLFTAQRRVASCRSESRTQMRTFYVQGERRKVHNVGDVQLVFSTTEKPTSCRSLKIQKVLMTNRASWSARQIVARYDVRWQIELMFKELKSTLGMDDYRFRDFGKVEHFVTACLVAFLYLEWYRRQRLRQRTITDQERKHCTSQRSDGMCRLVRQQAESNDLGYIARACRTPTGLRRLRHRLKQALPLEHRPKR